MKFENIGVMPLKRPVKMVVLADLTNIPSIILEEEPMRLLYKATLLQLAYRCNRLQNRTSSNESGQDLEPLQATPMVKIIVFTGKI